jgi:hypothetical protein
LDRHPGITDEIERIGNEDARCRQLRQIPGFGPLLSTATVAAIGNGGAFRKGRVLRSLLYTATCKKRQVSRKKSHVRLSNNSVDGPMTLAV